MKSPSISSAQQTNNINGVLTAHLRKALKASSKEMVATKSRTKTFKSGLFLRHRIVLSILSSTSIRVTNIRDDDTTPGLSPSEISFIRLIDKITKGSLIEINETGTSLYYKPGILLGGSRLSHNCHPSRSISYYLEPLIMLAPFAKHPLSITLNGPTHAPSEICVDTLSAVTVPLLRRLTLGSGLSPTIEIRKRAACSDANANGKAGNIHFRCDIVRSKLKPIELTDPGFVKRIRGLAFGNKVSPAYIGRMVDTTRGVLNRFTPDVYVHTDHNNNADCGIGYGMHLLAETTEGCLIGADWSGVRKEHTPEEVAKAAVNMLLEEIDAGGCVDSSNTCLALLYCALADADLNSVRVGRLSKAAVQFLRDLETFFGVVFNIKIERREDSAGEAEEEEEHDDEDEEGQEGETQPRRQSGILLSCIGTSHTNLARPRF